MSEELEESPYPAVMVCPKCGGDMKEFTFEVVSLDRCQACRGMWFDAGELEKMLALDHRAAIDEKHSRTPAGVDEKKMECPRCGGLLIKMHHLQRPEITLDGCLVCYGTWLDGGEFAGLQAHGWLAKARDLLHGIFGRE